MPIYLVRHTTYENPDHIIALRLPLELSQKGIDQAHQLGHYFFDKKIAAIFSSPVKRSYQTAQIISDHLKIPVEIDDRFTEVENSSIQGQSRDGVQQCLYTFPGSEPKRDIQQRMLSGVQDAVKLKRPVVIVSHGDPITILLFHLINQATPTEPSSGEDCYVRKGEIVKLNFTPDGEFTDYESVPLGFSDK